MSTERKVQAGFAIALACLCVVGAASCISVARLNENMVWVEHTREVISRLDLLLSKMTDAQNGYRGYAVTGDEAYLEPYFEAVQTAAGDVARLRGLTADNPARQQRLEQLGSQVAAQLAFSREVAEARRSQGFAAAENLILTGQGKRLHDRLRGLVNVMKGAEERLLKEHELAARRRSVFTQALIVGGSVLAFGLVGLALLVVRRSFAERRYAQTQLDHFFSLSQ
jgi:methyl-accepting chemotaxis protein